MFAKNTQYRLHKIARTGRYQKSSLKQLGVLQRKLGVRYIPGTGDKRHASQNGLREGNKNKERTKQEK